MPSDTKEIQALKLNLNVTKSFLDLVEKIDALPDMKKTRFTETRSLYQAVSKGRKVEEMEQELTEFFGPPAKPAGKSLSLLLRRNPSIKYLDGIREEQILFIRKVKSGFYYGALWPWRRDPMQVTVHLGFLSSKMSDKDFKKLEELVKSKVMHEKVFEKLDDGSGGQVQGISLASFLQMAAMEKITCTLKIQKDKEIGYLYLLKGDLISAETGTLKNKQAAHKIISWDNTVIDIEQESGKTENEINQPIVNILLEAAKIRETESRRKKRAPAAAKDKKEVPDEDQDVIITLEDEVALAVDEALKPVAKEVKIKKKLSTKKLALAVVAVIAIAGIAFLALRFVKSRRVEAEYQNALATAEKLPGLNAQEKILKNFITSHQQSEYAKSAEEKIEEIRKRFAKKDFKITLKNAEQLIQNNEHEKLAAVYQAYLKKYPHSIHSAAIRKKLTEITTFNDNSDYNKLIRSAGNDNTERIYSYVQYLEKHPKGKYRDEVNKLIANMSKEYYLFFNKKIAVCNSQEDWEKCIQACDEFLKIYPDHQQANEIKKYQMVAGKKLEDKKILDDLKNSAEGAGHDYKAAKQVYFDYLNSHSETHLKDRIIAEIKKMKEKEKLVWLREEREKIAASIKASGGRFVDNRDDTIKDTKTGLTWCTLDSMQTMNDCLNYEAAQKYVKDLKTGGHQDWRLPTEKELVEIYKNKPFFPLREAKWYWTSKSFSRYSDGWQEMVQIVTTKREAVWNNRQANARECGAVQAVRP